MNSEFSLKEPSLANYKIFFQNQISKFEKHHFEHIPRTKNGYVNALATTASKSKTEGANKAIIKIMKKHTSHFKSE